MTTWYETTRLHDDAVRVAAQVNESQAPLKYMTYRPDYLSEGSCVVGNNENCHVFGPMDVDDESRVGALTNKRVLNRPVTQAPDDGRVGGPNMTSASAYVREGQQWFSYGMSESPNSGIPLDPLISNEMFDAWDRLHQAQPFNRACDLDVVGQPVTHHLDYDLEMSKPQQGYANRLFDRDDIRRSTRVERRNGWANCEKKS